MTEPTRSTVTTLLPSIVPLPETAESQEKARIEISLAPVSYTLPVDTVEQLQPVEASFGETVVLDERRRSQHA